MENEYPALIDRFKSTMIDTVVIILGMFICSKLLEAADPSDGTIRGEDPDRRINFIQAFIRFLLKVAFGWLSFLTIVSSVTFSWISGTFIRVVL